MALFVINNNGENHYINACNKDRALWFVKKRLLSKYGHYNITDIREVYQASSGKPGLRRDKKVSTLKNKFITERS